MFIVHCGDWTFDIQLGCVEMALESGKTLFMINEKLLFLHKSIYIQLFKACLEYN